MLRLAAYLLVFFSLFAGGLNPAHAAKRVALVIGNSAYEHAPELKTPRNDAAAISVVLKKLGFEVVTGIDLTHLDFARIVGHFRKKLQGADVGLFFYAGHGLQVNGSNYLVPVDAVLDDETSLDVETVPLSLILKLMKRSTKTNLVFLDACRDNPLARNLARGMGTRSTAVGRGLARVESGLITMITFATRPDNFALDGDGTNSPFTEALLDHIETPGLDIANLMRAVRLDVLTRTQRQQVPWSNSSLTGSFIFNDKLKEEPKPVANGLFNRQRELAELEKRQIELDAAIRNAEAARQAWRGVGGGIGSGVGPGVGSGTSSGTFSRRTWPGGGSSAGAGGSSGGGGKLAHSVGSKGGTSDGRAGGTGGSELYGLASGPTELEKSQIEADAAIRNAEADRQAEVYSLADGPPPAPAKEPPPPPVPPAAPAVSLAAPTLMVLPRFPWPPPEPSARMHMPREPFQSASDLDAVSALLVNQLREAGYWEYSFHRVDNGFALVTRLERINDDGSPMDSLQRYQRSTDAEPFSLSSYIKHLFFAPQGYYRVIIFIVTDRMFAATGAPIKEKEATKLLHQGANVLPPEYKQMAFTEKHGIDVLIYEYLKGPQDRQVSLLLPGRLSPKMHFDKSGLMAAFDWRRK